MGKASPGVLYGAMLHAGTTAQLPQLPHAKRDEEVLDDSNFWRYEYY